MRGPGRTLGFDHQTAIDRLAIGEDYGHIQLLDLRTGTVVSFPTQSSEGVHALVFSADEKLLAAGLGSTVRLWDANSGESRGQLTNHTEGEKPQNGARSEMS